MLRPAAVVVAALVAHLAVGQPQDCQYPNNEDIFNAVSSNITAGISPPSVDVHEFAVLCLSHGVRRDRYRHASVLVEYSCENISVCTSDAMVEQLVMACVENTWSFVSSNVTSTAANFSTELREDCSSCFDVAGPQTDPVTNCVGKPWTFKSSINDAIHIEDSLYCMTLHVKCYFATLNIISTAVNP